MAQRVSSENHALLMKVDEDQIRRNLLLQGLEELLSCLPQRTEEAVLKLVNDNFPIWILISKQGDMA
jgi:hypothetical protein